MTCKKTRREDVRPAHGTNRTNGTNEAKWTKWTKVAGVQEKVLADRFPGAAAESIRAALTAPANRENLATFPG